MVKAKLIELDKCTECRSCVTACQNQNKNEPNTEGKKADEIRKAYLECNGADELSHEDWTIISQKDPKDPTRYYKKQCMHCDDPQCVKNCPAHAITKYDNGAVVIDPEKCEGVKLCIEACPFDIPKFDEHKHTVVKCRLCFERITQNPPLDPACVTACPSKAMKFGERDELVEYAKSNYKYIYGGGVGWNSSVIYASNVPIEEVGITKAEIHGIPDLLRTITHPIGVAMLVGGAGLAALNAMKSRKEKVAETETK